MSRLKMMISLLLLASPRLGAQQTGKLPSRPEFVNVPPEVAATHILKKGEPVYPAFAKAVGMQGVVRIGIAVGPRGHLNATKSVISGWACLEQAARDAASQYVFRPFEKDGRPVIAETAVDIVFKLPDDKKIFNPPPPPPMLDRFEDFRSARSASDLSPELGKWLDSNSSASDSSQLAFDSAVAVETPTRNPSVRLYIVTEQTSPECGTGGCPVQLVEQTAGSFRLLVSYRPAWCFYAHTRQGSVYPDVFFLATSGMSGSVVTGYSEVGGEWVVLYCGDSKSVHVCR
jgi:hypothetical protein